MFKSSRRQIFRRGTMKENDKSARWSKELHSRSTHRARCIRKIKNGKGLPSGSSHTFQTDQTLVNVDNEEYPIITIAVETKLPGRVSWRRCFLELHFPFLLALRRSHSRQTWCERKPTINHSDWQQSFSSHIGSRSSGQPYHRVDFVRNIIVI